MSETCPGDTSSHNKRKQQEQEQERRLQERLAHIRHRWLVLSGKGGVGKSTVAVNLACALADRGCTVGLLDTDIHGPDVVKMLGLEGRTFGGTEQSIDPVKAYQRLKVVSMASLMPDPDQAVIWRGPMKMGAIRQFLADVSWGDLDHLVVDSPPGTGDEPLSTAQLIGKADGAIIVTSPQGVALLDSRKCVSFARQLGIPVTGIIENMSGMLCPHCEKPIDLFGSGGGERAARELGVSFLGAIPVDLQIVQSGDSGRPFVHFQPESRAATAFAAIVDRILSSGDPTAGGDVERRADASIKLIAIACEDDRGLQGQVSAHFGRCPFYTLVEVRDDQLVGHRVEQNPNITQHRPGAMPQFIHALGANVILAGGMGPMAVDMFQRFGIEVATGAAGRVQDVLDAYLKGTLRGILPCNHDHPDSCGAHQPGERCGEDRRPHVTAARRVVIPAVDDSGLGAAMDPRFGRAHFFLIVDPASGKLLDTLPNTATEEAHGAGTQAARMMSEQGVGAIVAGRFGPKAIQVLDALGIELWIAPEGLTVSQALQKFQAGDLSRAS